MPAPDGYITEVAVKVEDVDAALHIGVNESYVLVIDHNSPVVQLTANTRFGLIRGSHPIFLYDGSYFAKL